MLVQFGNNWIKKIPQTHQIVQIGLGSIQFWLSSKFFSSNYFHSGQHVVLLHILKIINYNNNSRLFDTEYVPNDTKRPVQ